MKKLNINNTGRMPLWQKDLEWIQKGYAEPLEAIVGELGMSKEYFIITGCSPYMPDSGHIAMNSGWFHWGGRILPVRPLRSTSVTSFTNPVVRLTLVPYADPDGARSFIRADQTTAIVGNVWKDDYLSPTVVERSASFTDGVKIGVGAWTLRDIITRRNAEAESEWIPSRTGEMQFKRIGRLVVLRGTVADTTPLMVSVDEGFPAPIGGLAVLRAASGNNDLNIRITAEGDLVCSSQTLHSDIDLTGMTYLAATPYTASDNDPNTIKERPEV